MRKLTYPSNDFEGGVNNVAALVEVKENQSPDLQNVWLDEKKSISKQETGTLMATLPDGTEGTGMWEYRNGAGDVFLIATTANGINSKTFYSQDGINWSAAADGTVGTTLSSPASQGSGATITPASMNNIRVGSVLILGNEFITVISTGSGNFTANTAGSHGAGTALTGNVIIRSEEYWPEGVTFKDKFWMVDGENPMLVFDGASWLPAGAPKAAINEAAGNLTGDYQYIVSFVYQTVEYVIGAKSWKVSPSGQQVDLTGIPQGIPGITQINIYRNKAGNLNNFFQAYVMGGPAANPNPITETWTDNIADASLVNAMPPVNAPVPVGKYPVVHQSRLALLGYAGDPDTFQLSDIDLPYCFTTANGGFEETLPLQGDVICGGKSTGDSLEIFTQNNEYQMSGDGVNSPYTVARVLNKEGSAFHRSIQETYHYGQQLTAFLGRQDIQALNGTRDPVNLSGNVLLNQVKKTLQAEIEAHTQVYTSQADWNLGTITPDALHSLDLSTKPGDVLLYSDPWEQTPSGTQYTDTNTNYNITPQGPWEQIEESGAQEESPNHNGFMSNAGGAQTGWYALIIPAGQSQTKSLYGVNGQDAIINQGDNLTVVSGGYGVTPVKADRLEINYRRVYDPLQTWPNQGADQFTLTIGGVDLYGNTIVFQAPLPGQTILNNEYSQEIILPKTMIVQNLQINMLIHGPTQKGFLFWAIDSLQYRVTQYVSQGIWTSPVINLSSNFKEFGQFLADLILNNQSANFQARWGNPAIPDGTWTAWTPISNGDVPAIPPLTGYGQIRAILSLATNTDLTNAAQYPNAKEYPCQLVPESGGNAYPFTQLNYGSIATPHTIINDGGSNVLQVVSPGGQATGIRWYNSGLGLNNTTGWTVEFKFKIPAPPSAGVPYNSFVLFFLISDGTDVTAIDINNTNITLSGESQNAASAGNYNDGEWHVVHVTGKANAMNLYLDGNPVPLLTIANSATIKNNELSFGYYNLFSPPAYPYEYRMAYVAWDNTGAYAPDVLDKTSTPDLEDVSLFWKTSTAGIFPVTTVSSAYFNKKYWLACTEAPYTDTLRTSASADASGVETFNNVVLILDKNGSWVIKRGMFAGAMSIFNFKLWWVDSRNCNVYRLDDNPKTENFAAAQEDRFFSYYFTKKRNYNTDREKTYFEIRLRYKADAGINVTALVDDTMAFWQALPGTNGLTVKAQLGFPNNGRQNGSHLQLVFDNNIGHSGLIASDFEIYDFETDMWVLEDFYSSPAVVMG